MLERTARCLDSGARPSAWRSARGPMQSKRMLHSDFWRHGAGDLELPSWGLTGIRSLFEHNLSPRPDNITSHLGTNAPEPPFLDFLYPPSARELLQRESRSSSSRSSRAAGPRPRRYISQSRLGSRDNSTSQRSQSSLATARLDQRDDALLAAIRVYTDHATSTSAPGHARAKVSEASVAPTSTSKLSTDDWSKLELFRRNLDFLKRNDGRVSFSDAFDAYQALPAALRSPAMAKDLVNIMSDARSVPDAWRITKLWRDIPIKGRDVDIYSSVIAAYDRAKAPGRAVLIHDEALQNLRINSEFKATANLIYRLLGTRHWQLLLHLYTTRRSYHLSKNDEQGFREWLQTLEQDLCQGHDKDYPAQLLRFLESLAKYPYIVSDNGVKSCVRHMAHAVYGGGLTFGKQKTAAALKLLRGLDMASAFIYEGAIRSVKQMATTPEDQHRLAMHYYDDYRKDYHDFKPTKTLLHRLLAAATKANDGDAVSAIVDDWQSHYGRLNNNAAGLLVAWRARRGEIGKAESELSALVGSRGDVVTWKRLLPLLHGDAMLGKPEAVEKRLSEAETEYGLTASIVAYNTLLLAYLRQDDYTGLMSTFTRIIEAGLRPDAHTFGTVMALTADRGDADLTEEFRRMASSYNIRNHVLDEELVLAHINNNDMSKAEELAAEFTTTEPSTGTTRMWTQLLLGYASRRNPRAAIDTSQRMTKLGIKFDRVSYAALMRVFIEDKKPRLAQELMNRMTAKDKLQPLAIHYAMLIQAYVHESRFETAFRAYARMLDQGITATLSVRVALLQLHARAAQQKYKMDTRTHPGVRFDVAEELLEEFLSDDEAKITATKEPQIVKLAGNLDRSHYFQVLLDVYGKQKAYSAVEMLLQRYAMQPGQFGRGDESKSLKILLQVMRLRCAQGDFDDVARYWQLAKQRAVDQTSTVRATKPRLPISKRNLLSRHLDVYMRASQASGRQSEMLGTFQELVELGFDLDYLNWNRYVYMLLKNRRVVEAFVLCERNLMDSFPGWTRKERRSRFLVASGRKGQGLQHIGDRMSFVEPGVLTVTHTTMLHLHMAIRGLQAASWYRPSAQQTLDELQKSAPRTVEAALQTPGVRGVRRRTRRTAPIDSK